MVACCSFPPSHLPPVWSPFPAGGCSASVSLPCTNPGLFPLCQYTSKLMSCKVTSEVLFNLFVFSSCMPGPGACRCGLPFPDALNEKGKKTVRLRVSFFPAFSEAGHSLLGNVGVHAAVIHPAVLCRAVPCGGIGEELALLIDLEGVWTRGHNPRTFLVSSGTDSKHTLAWWKTMQLKRTESFV